MKLKRRKIRRGRIEIVPMTPPGRIMTFRVRALVPSQEGLQWVRVLWVLIKTPKGWRVDIPLTNAVNMPYGMALPRAEDQPYRRLGVGS